MDKPVPIDQKNCSVTLDKLDNIEDISPSDTLKLFYKNSYPKIKDKYFSFPAQTKRVMVELFSKKQEKNKFDKREDTIYKLFWAEVAKWIFDFIIWENIHDVKRIYLFLNVMYLEMTTTAYLNSRLDFHNCAKAFEDVWQVEKSRIIKKSLNLCDQRFKEGLITIGLSPDWKYLIFENSYGTTLQSKEDFLNSSNDKIDNKK